VKEIKIITKYLKNKKKTIKKKLATPQKKEKETRAKLIQLEELEKKYSLNSEIIILGINYF
jgi:hypothetical protein